MRYVYYLLTSLLLLAATGRAQALLLQWHHLDPTGRYLNGQAIPNLITVGASARTNDEHLPAPFSNYGRQLVDVFAPGFDSMSSFPGNEYRPMSGTSIATPVVAGIAAVLKTYFPQLTPADLKRVILASAKPCHTQVLKPGTMKLVDFVTLSRTAGVTQWLRLRRKVDFVTLSRTGRVVNLYEAVRLASSSPVAPATRWLFLRQSSGAH